MDFLQLFYSFVLIILITLKDVSSFTLTAYKSDDKAIFGNNQFTLSCTYSTEVNEQLFSIVLKRKRGTESDFSTIVTFQNPTSTFNATYQDTSLESRTVATNPTESSKTATIVFSEIDCNDKATYRWDAFYSDGSNQNAVKDSSFVVKAKTLFPQDGSISHSPNTNIEEGDKVVFTCSGDVGNEPVGYLGWFYYLNNDTSSAVNASSSANTVAPVYQSNTCSYTRTSTLELTMKKEFHNILVRCTVQQDKFDQFGDDYVQTKNIPVFYSPKVTPIQDKEEVEGTEMLTLMCYADAYPAPFFSWVMPDGTVSDGPSINLTDLQLGDNGTYTCVVYNTFKGVNHTVNETTYINVRTTTTPPPTTTTTTTPTGSADKLVTKAPPSTQSNSDKTTIIIVVCVVVGLLIIIGIVVVILCVKKRNKPKEIEEPPEKPRNNQDLSFYGNRPDLVSSDHGMKNNMGNSALNSSFNNSFDSTSDIKSRNEDGLFDVQFDDKPRSRRPIQLLDNMGGSGSYGDIVNPRV